MAVAKAVFVALVAVAVALAAARWARTRAPATAQVEDAPLLSTAVNGKGLKTHRVLYKLYDPFSSIRHCLPVHLAVKAAQPDSNEHFGVVEVNTTSLEGSYSMSTVVENGQLVCSQPRGTSWH